MVTNELKRLSRRIDSHGKTIDLIYKDRDILEDILNRLTAIESAINLQRSKATDTAKEIKTNIEGVQEAVEAKIDQVNVVTDEKTVIVKGPKDNVLKQIVDKVSGK